MGDNKIKAELGQLRDRVERLSSLIEVGAIISSSLDLGEVLRLVMTKTQRVMEAETCSILLLDEETDELRFSLALGNDAETVRTLKEEIRLKMGQGVAGWCAQNRQSVLVSDVSQDERHFTGADLATGYTTRSLMAVPLINKDQLIGVAELVNPLNKDSFEASDLELFETFCRQVAIAIDNARYHQAFLAQQRLKEQLAIASEIQRNFLPPPLSRKQERSFGLKAVSLPALEVGGDLYDYFLLPGGRLALLFGDVSGKGVGAALYMARVVSEFRYLARLLGDPGAVLNALNVSLCKDSTVNMFVTAVSWLLDLNRGIISFANAGHLPSLWRGADGSVKMAPSAAGPPLGIFEDEDYQASRLELLPGDSLVMLTDGVIEAFNEKREQYGYRRLIELIEGLKPEEEVIDRVVESVRRFSTGLSPSDDLTLLELNWPGPSPERRPARVEPVPDKAASRSVHLDLVLSPSLLGAVRDVARRMALLGGLDQSEANAFRLAVDEAATNVLRHAYGGDTSRRLCVNFEVTPSQLRAELHDFGVGFDPEAVSAPQLPRLEPGGLGLKLIKSIMDEVKYVHLGIEGNTLTLIKYLPTQNGKSEHEDRSRAD